MKNIKISENLIIVFFTSFSFFLIYKDFYNGFWFDEWSSFYYSNPNNLNLDRKLNDGASEYYFIILTLWNKLFGYYPESVRMFSSAFGLLSFVIFFKLAKEIEQKNSFLILTSSLFVTNFFFLYYSVEARWYTFSLFLSLLSVFFFFKSQKKIFFYFFLFPILILCILINTFSVVILISAFLYSLFYKIKNLFWFSLACALFLLFINKDIFFSFTNTDQIKSFYIESSFTKNFFLGYFFNNFFGNIYFGGLILILINFIILYFNFNLLKNKKINFIIFIICLSYFVPLLYEILFTPILRARYIIFVIPLIIIFLSYFIIKIPNNFFSKMITYALILLTFVNLRFHKEYVPKPPINDAIEIISKSNHKKILLKENTLFANSLLFSKFAKKKKIKFYNNYNNLNAFWTICLNSPRFATSEQIDKPECFENEFSDKYILKRIRKITDLVLRQYERDF